MAHYNKQELISALKRSGLKKGDIVFGHSNIGYFGFPEEGKDQNTIFKTILESFFEVIGPEGTIVAPTFTYSFPKGEVFDPDNTPGIGGVFSELIRELPESYRSIDPSVSVVAVGGKAKELTANMPSDSYDENGIFGRLLNQNAKVCNMNIDAATTFVHYAERKYQVPYRFDKTFKGTISINGEKKNIENTIWVRYLIEETKPVFEPFDRIAMKKKYCKCELVGRGFIKTMSIRDQYKLVMETLPSKPWFLTQAGVSGNIPDPSLFVDANK